MIRPAHAGDVPAIHRMILELARYERAAPEVTAAEGDLRTALLSAPPSVFAHVAEEDGAVVGFALWFLTYSTWLGRHGVYLEDLYVAPPARGRGHGAGLLAALARICVRRGYGRLEWRVLDWNTPALRFYASLGAAPLDGWTTCRLAGHALRALGGAGG